MKTRRHNTNHIPTSTSHALKAAWQVLCHPIWGFLSIVVTLALAILH